LVCPSKDFRNGDNGGLQLILVATDDRTADILALTV